MSPYSQMKKKLESPGGRKIGMYCNMLCVIFFLPNYKQER